MPEVVQINVSSGGVPKLPIAEAVVTPLGIVGDVQAHPKIHGGPKQALLLIAAEVVDELKEKGYSVYYGALGENITTRGVNHRMFRSGQRYQIGEVVVELTKPRSPCYQLNPYGPGIQDDIYDLRVRLGDHRSSKWGMSGFYASIITPGTIAVGAPIRLLEELA